MADEKFTDFTATPSPAPTDEFVGVNAAGDTYIRTPFSAFGAGAGVTSIAGQNGVVTEQELKDSAHIYDVLQNLYEKPVGEPIVFVFTGQSNCTGAVTEPNSSTYDPNPNVFEWRSVDPPEIPQVGPFSWEVADCNRAIVTTIGSPAPAPYTGLIGRADLNTRSNMGWIMADMLQKATGRDVYMITVHWSGRAIAEWLTGAPARVELDTQVADALPEIPGAPTTVDFVVWMQGESDLGNGRTAQEYATDWASQKTLCETAGWAVNHKTKWFICDFVPDLLPNQRAWGGLNLATEQGGSYVTFVPSGGIINNDAFARVHYEGINLTEMGRRLFHAYLGTLPAKPGQNRDAGYLGWVNGAVSDRPDGASAIAFKFNQPLSMVNAGAKLLDIQYQGVSKLSMKPNGELTTPSGSFISTVADGGTAIGFKLNVSNTLVDPGANVFDLQMGGVSQLRVDEAGQLYPKTGIITPLFYSDLFGSSVFYGPVTMQLASTKLVKVCADTIGEECMVFQSIGPTGDLTAANIKPFVFKNENAIIFEINKAGRLKVIDAIYREMANTSNELGLRVNVATSAGGPITTAGTKPFVVMNNGVSIFYVDKDGYIGNTKIIEPATTFGSIPTVPFLEVLGTRSLSYTNPSIGSPIKLAGTYIFNNSNLFQDTGALLNVTGVFKTPNGVATNFTPPASIRTQSIFQIDNAPSQVISLLWLDIVSAPIIDILGTPSTPAPLLGNMTHFTTKGTVDTGMDVSQRFCYQAGALEANGGTLTNQVGFIAQASAGNSLYDIHFHFGTLNGTAPTGDWGMYQEDTFIHKLNAGIVHKLLEVGNSPVTLTKGVRTVVLQYTTTGQITLPSKANMEANGHGAGLSGYEIVVINERNAATTVIKAADCDWGTLLAEAESIPAYRSKTYTYKAGGGSNAVWY